ncbi:protein BEAN1 isoform X3 [Pogona vitticeps]
MLVSDKSRRGVPTKTRFRVQGRDARAACSAGGSPPSTPDGGKAGERKAKPAGAVRGGTALTRPSLRPPAQLGRFGEGGVPRSRRAASPARRFSAAASSVAGGGEGSAGPAAPPDAARILRPSRGSASRPGSRESAFPRSPRRSESSPAAASPRLAWPRPPPPSAPPPPPCTLLRQGCSRPDWRRRRGSREGGGEPSFPPAAAAGPGADGENGLLVDALRLIALLAHIQLLIYNSGSQPWTTQVFLDCWMYNIKNFWLIL